VKYNQTYLGTRKDEIQMTFNHRIYKLVKKIPSGKVTTYGQVASLLGSPRSALQVGWALRICPEDIPWQRVINREGMISIENLHFPKELQVNLLKKEGVVVEFKHGNWWVDLDNYLWQPNEKDLLS
jgi:methylated-DNA-protein-cysteine methyltransferase-like protein